MSILLVGYDLNQPGQHYQELIRYLKSHIDWCRPLDSTWLIKTAETPAQLLDQVRARTDANDQVLVMNVTGDDWATYGFSKEVNDWLQANL